MIFTFDDRFRNPDSLETFLSGAKDTEETLSSCFVNLITGWWEGKLALLMPTVLKEKLCDPSRDLLSSREKRRLKLLFRHRRQELGKLYEFLKLKVLITPELDASAPYVLSPKGMRNDHPVVHETCDDHPQQLRVPLRYFVDSARVQQPVVIAEHDRAIVQSSNS